MLCPLTTVSPLQVYPVGTSPASYLFLSGKFRDWKFGKNRLLMSSGIFVLYLPLGDDTFLLTIRGFHQRLVCEGLARLISLGYIIFSALGCSFLIYFALLHRAMGVSIWSGHSALGIGPWLQLNTTTFIYKVCWFMSYAVVPNKQTSCCDQWIKVMIVLSQTCSEWAVLIPERPSDKQYQLSVIFFTSFNS